MPATPPPKPSPTRTSAWTPYLTSSVPAAGLCLSLALSASVASAQSIP